MKQNEKDLLDNFYETLRRHKLAVTPQRIGIYRELMKNPDHPSVNTIYKRIKKVFPRISFDTVYRTLLSFSDIGLLDLVEGYGEEKRFDINMKKHHHLRCVRCHKVIDFYCPEYDKLKIPCEVRGNFEIINKKVVLEGICEECKDSK